MRRLRALFRERPLAASLMMMMVMMMMMRRVLMRIVWLKRSLG